MTSCKRLPARYNENDRMQRPPENSPARDPLKTIPCTRSNENDRMQRPPVNHLLQKIYYKRLLDFFKGLYTQHSNPLKMFITLKIRIT